MHLNYFFCHKNNSRRGFVLLIDFFLKLGDILNKLGELDESIFARGVFHSLAAGFLTPSIFISQITEHSWPQSYLTHPWTLSDQPLVASFFDCLLCPFWMRLTHPQISSLIWYFVRPTASYLMFGFFTSQLRWSIVYDPFSGCLFCT